MDLVFLRGIKKLMSRNLIANIMYRLGALYLCILCSSAFCLSLGSLKVYSLLNQPLKASIEIMHANDIEAEEILPNLASIEDFEMAKLKRSSSLSNIECKIITDSLNNKYIDISTVDPIQEPSIALLIEVHWPQGRILKEYSLLLTPNHVEVTKRPSTQTSIYKKAVQPQPKIPTIKKSNYDVYYTKTGDTLWSVASKMADKQNLTTQQTMQLIFNNNPRAFINKDKTKLQANYKLIIPIANIKAYKKGATNKKPIKAPVAPKNPVFPNADLTKQKAVDNDKAKTDNTKKQNLVAAKATKINKDITSVPANPQTITKDSTLAPIEKNVTDTNQQQVKSASDEIDQQAKKTIKEVTTIKKTSTPKITEEQSFFHIFIIPIIVLLFLAIAFISYRRLNKTKNKTDTTSDEHDIVDDYSQPQTQEEHIENRETQQHTELNLTAIERAEEFIAKDESHKAILILNQALSINPKDLEVNFKLTELYCNLNDKDNARKMMANALQTNDKKLQKKLESLKTQFPNLFVHQAIEDQDDWSIDDTNITADDDILDDDHEIISNVSISPQKDDLSFLENSELSEQSTIDEIFKGDTVVPKEKSEELRNSKLDVAKGYIDIGDDAEAIKILNEIVSSGTEEEQKTAKKLLDNLKNDKPE